MTETITRAVDLLRVASDVIFDHAHNSPVAYADQKLEGCDFCMMLDEAAEALKALTNQEPKPGLAELAKYEAEAE